MTLVFARIGWPTLARRVRSQLLATRSEDYVLPTELSGATPYRATYRHLLPSVTS